MKRREFITLLGISAVPSIGWPLGVLAQQKIPTIGFLGTASEAAWKQWVAGFVDRLRDLGWTEGRTVTIEVRWAEGNEQRFAEIAAEFVKLKVDVIVTSGAAGIAAKRATTTIPIVFAVANDPVGSGLVASLSRPGGNVTGLSLQAGELTGKRLEFMKEILPTFGRLAVLGNVGYSAAALEMREISEAAFRLGIEVIRLEIRNPDDIAAALEMAKGRADALYISTDPVVNTNRVRIHDLAMGAKLPAMSGVREYAAAGGVMSYGPSYPDLFRRAADLVDKILRGTKPGDIPIEQPTKFELVFNLKTAKALGITVPPRLLFTADEVIE